MSILTTTMDRAFQRAHTQVCLWLSDKNSKTSHFLSTHTTAVQNLNTTFPSWKIFVWIFIAGQLERKNVTWVFKAHFQPCFEMSSHFSFNVTEAVTKLRMAMQEPLLPSKKIRNHFHGGQSGFCLRKSWSLAHHFLSRVINNEAYLSWLMP